MNRLHWMLLVAVLALSMACAPSEARPSPGAQPTGGEPKRGGTMVLNGAASSGADPALGQIPISPWHYIGEPMLRRHPDTFALQPAALESWQISSDGKEIIFKVRQGMKFHNKPPVNGREVEARDIVYMIRSTSGLQYPELSPTRFPRKANYKAMEDVVALDKYTVKITLKQPSITFLQSLADHRNTFVYPEGLREAFPGGVDSLVVPNAERDIASGPFIFTKYETDVLAEFERNPNYYQKEYPYLDKIRLVNIVDTAAQNAAFVAGQIDILSTNTAQARNFVVKNFPEAQIVTYKPARGWDRLSLNVTRKPFDDYRVRRALYLTIDKKTVGEVYVGSYEGKPLWNWPGIIHWTYPEARPQEELAKNPLFQGPTPVNVAEAKRLLKEAGYENGFEFTAHTTPSYLDYVQVIEADWAKHLKVKMNIKAVDAAVHLALATKGEYDAQFYSHQSDATAVAHVAAAYHTQGGRNYGRNSDPKLDAMLDEAEGILDLVKYKELMRKIEDYIMDYNLSMLPTDQGWNQVALAPYVRGTEYGANTEDRSAYKWWIDK